MHSFVSGFFHSILYMFYSSLLSPIAVVYSFSLLKSVPVNQCHKFSIFVVFVVQLTMDIWMVYGFWLLQTMLLWTFLIVFSDAHMNTFLLDLYLRGKLLPGHKLCVYSALVIPDKQFSKVVVFAWTLGNCSFCSSKLNINNFNGSSSNLHIYQLCVRVPVAPHPLPLVILSPFRFSHFSECAVLALFNFNFHFHDD